MNTVLRLHVATAQWSGYPATDLSWGQYGACGAIDVDLCFPDHKEDSRLATSRRVCRSCPVRPPCREYAVAAKEPYGVWGGLGPTALARVHDERLAAHRAAVAAVTELANYRRGIW